MGRVLDPFLLDTTGQDIKEALNGLAQVLQPENTYVDIAATIHVSDWSNSAPFRYNWLNAHVTSECGVEVRFTQNNPVDYIGYEKIDGGVRFSAPYKPASDVYVTVRVISAAADSVTETDATLVSTEAVDGASNVEEGLAAHEATVTALEDGISYRLGNTNTTGGTLAVGTFVYVHGNSTLNDGMYTVSTAISNGGTLSSANCSPVSAGGGLNSLNSKIGNLQFSVVERSFSFDNADSAGISIASGTDDVIINAQMLIAYRDGNFYRVTRNGAKTWLTAKADSAISSTQTIKILCIK